MESFAKLVILFRNVANDSTKEKSSTNDTSFTEFEQDFQEILAFWSKGMDLESILHNRERRHAGRQGTRFHQIN